MLPAILSSCAESSHSPNTAPAEPGMLERRQYSFSPMRGSIVLSQSKKPESCIVRSLCFPRNFEDGGKGVVRMVNAGCCNPQASDN